MQGSGVRNQIGDTDEKPEVSSTRSERKTGVKFKLTWRTDLRTFILEVNMTTKKVTEARANLYGLIDEANASHDPILITGKRANAVLISEDDWRSIQETLYLLSIPGMRSSILQGIETPLKDCSKVLKW
jgi:prevent-host-death family protein